MSVLLFVLLIGFIFLGVPIGFSILLSSTLFLQITKMKPLVVVAQRMALGMDSFPLLAIPLFVLMGYIMESCGLSRRLVNFINSLTGNVKGAMGVVTVVCCTIFAALSGSGPATVAAIGSIMIPAMIENGYPDKSAAGLTAMAGALGPIIPPSIVMIVYGTTMNVSITKMFMGGVIPGILIAIVLILVNLGMARKWDLKVSHEKMTGKEKWAAFLHAFPVLLLPIIILGGIYGGIFTPTESATAGVVYSLILSLAYRKLTVKNFLESLKKTIVTSSMICFLIGAAAVFCWILSTARIPTAIAEAVVPALNGSKFLYWIILVGILMFIGCLMESLASVVVLAPILSPIGTALGINEIHLGVIFCITLIVGFVTPPFGANLFTVVGITKQPFGDVVKGVLPFLAATFATLIILILFPQLVTFLPGFVS